jgi:hypothetical protein
MKIICMGSHSSQFFSIIFFTHMDIHVGIHSSGHVTEWRKIVRFWCQSEMQFSLSLPLTLLSFPSTLGSEGMRKAESRQMSFASGELTSFNEHHKYCHQFLVPLSTTRSTIMASVTCSTTLIENECLPVYCVLSTYQFAGQDINAHATLKPQ